jgi:hypothetical protein
LAATKAWVALSKEGFVIIGGDPDQLSSAITASATPLAVDPLL